MEMYGVCDITVPVAAASNATALERCPTADIWMVNFCVVENTISLRQPGGFAFFSDIFGRAKPGAVFLFTDATHRLWPDLVSVAFETWFGSSFVPLHQPHVQHVAQGIAAVTARFLVSLPLLKGKSGCCGLFLCKPLSSALPDAAETLSSNSEAVGLEAALSDKNWQLLQLFGKDDARHRYDKPRDTRCVVDFQAAEGLESLDN
jgi:hypothetical protein